MEDPRRRIPRSDDLWTNSSILEARQQLGDAPVRRAVDAVLARARSGDIDPEQIESTLASELAGHSASLLRPVINATGVIVHTNLGRAPLSAWAVAAMTLASGYVDIELDLASGQRSARGRSARTALKERCTAAEDALIVNNGAAALVLATTALAGGAEIVLSRGEFVEIGAGFRLSDLISSTGVTLVEVGTTNRTHLGDYADAISDRTAALLKVHPSNFRIEGFTSEVGVDELAGLAAHHGLPLVVDIGSGLVTPDPLLPAEPAATEALAAGADLVIMSGDKLMGGPQAGIILGRASLIQRLARHPLARAVRCDKLTLAALEATIRVGQTPVSAYLHADADRLRERATRMAEALGGEVVAHDGRVGGGGGAGVSLSGWAVALPSAIALPLRTGDPAVLVRVHDGRCLIDLRCVPESEDMLVIEAARSALGGRTKARSSEFRGDANP